MKKIICPVCNEIIEVSDEHEEEVYCPKCFKHINVETGVKALAVYINKQKELGDIYLNDATEYEKAKKCFETVLNATPLDEEAAEGLIISTIRTSSLRNCKIEEATKYLEEHIDAFIDSNSDLVAGFLHIVFKDFDFYIETLKTRLTDKGVFYEQEGKMLYLNALKEIVSFKQIILSQIMNKIDFPSKLGISQEKTKNDIKYLNSLINEQYRVESSPFHLLKTDVKECSIDDQVFRDVRSLYSYRKTMVIWNAISFVILVLGIILIFALPKYLAIGVPTSIVGLILTTIFSILDVKTFKKIMAK